MSPRGVPAVLSEAQVAEQRMAAVRSRLSELADAIRKAEPDPHNVEQSPEVSEGIFAQLADYYEEVSGKLGASSPEALEVHRMIGILRR